MSAMTRAGVIEDAEDEPIFRLGALLRERATGILYEVVERSDETGTMFVEPQIGSGQEPWSEQWYLSQALGMIARGALVCEGMAAWTL